MSSEDPTAAELLTAVNAAILALLTRRVKSYSIAGTSYTYHDVGELRTLRAELRKETRTAGSTIRVADVSGT